MGRKNDTNEPQNPYFMPRLPQTITCKSFELTQMESRMHREVHVRFGSEYAKICLWVRRCALSLRIPVYNFLEDTMKLFKTVKGYKNDEKDSKWISELFRLGIVPNSFIPDKPIRILREYTRYRYKLVCNKSSEKNRFQCFYCL